MSIAIRFSPWVRWAARNNLPDRDKPGLYIIGRFTQPPRPGAADPFDRDVVYIGESSGGRFQGRWRSFDRAAFKGTGKHRGGKRYRERFGGDSTVLFVSTLSDEGLVGAFLKLNRCQLLDINASDAKVPIANELLSEIDDLLIKYIERRLILLYSLTHGHRPACNAD